ncbi:MAG: O-antigen ligase family protein [Candidatus Delongbacteria bacterium]|nr:O-antigen ligase family protein [Candidatus Delongbacteria bacterium]
MLISFFEIILFANRSSISTAVFFLFVIGLSNYKSNIVMLRKGLVYFLVFALIVAAYVPILNILVGLSEYFSVQSYSLTKISLTIKYGILIMMESRVLIWSDAIDHISKNPFFGSGIGSFEAIYGQYSHNIFLDIVVYFGIIGLLFFLFLTFYSLLRLTKYNYYCKIFAVLVLSSWVIPLLTSSNFFRNTNFWLFFSLILIVKRERVRIASKI